jgi:elongator complex protein 3
MESDKVFLSIYSAFLKELSEQQSAAATPLTMAVLNNLLQNSIRRNGLGTYPSKHKLLSSYNRLTEARLIERNQTVEMILTSKIIRSSSGVLPISVALDGNVFSCSYNCSYCPNECKDKGAEGNMARSYLSSEGTFIRGAVQDFNLVSQIWRRLAELEDLGHIPDKCEIIPLGGTFDCFPAEYRRHFILSVFYACNMYQHLSLRFNGSHSFMLKNWLDKKPFLNGLALSKEIIDALHNLRPMSTESNCDTITLEQEINTTAPCCRVIGIVVETRPDRINRSTLQEMRMEGVTRVQLGIQSTDDSVLALNSRGHTVKSSINALTYLRDAGFKVDGHLMPDLPGTSLETDYKMMRDVFSGSDLQLDYTKIYPCLDLPYTQIREWKENGQWLPIAENKFPEFLTFLCDTMAMVPPWTRINRVQRDFPEANIKNHGLGYVSDTIKTNLQQIVKLEMEKRGMKCFDIRSREIGTQMLHTIIDKCKLYIRIYRANGGTEFFISVEAPKGDSDPSSPKPHFDDTFLLGLCRLRIPDYEFVKNGIPSYYIKEFRRTDGRVARIRELHTYGSLSSSIPSSEGATQHKGIGKFLVRVAENIATIYGCTRVAVISGVGARDYYVHQGYALSNTYMCKDLGRAQEGYEARMSLFGKTYSYNELSSVVLTSMVSRTYIDPIWTRDSDTIQNPSPSPSPSPSTIRHIYENIQYGDAEGYALIPICVIATDTEPSLILLLLVGLAAYAIITCVLLHVLTY